MADAAYDFLSFVRGGFAASIAQPDTFGAAQPAVARATVGVAVSGVAAPVTHDIAVQGPGDVVGVTPSQVVRTDPIDGAVGVEPNYFALVEFDRPDLPWMFTPAAAVGERLRPWIALVVVDAAGPGACTLVPGAPLPQLHVPHEAADELPDLADSYLWAHGQVVRPDGQSIDAALAGDPRLTLSRLVSPRHLEPNTDYLVAVVPTFDIGRLAGLGQTVSDADVGQLAPAWTPGTATVLPVFHSFRFRTGEEADFESLARKLTGRPLPAGVGVRALDVSRPGAGLPALPAPASRDDTRSITRTGGALQAIDSRAPARDAAAEAEFRAHLTVLLDRPAQLLRAGDADPVVAPPLYGGMHALVVELGAGNPPPWIVDLNLDARNRVAAGLGTQIVQARQEDLVDRAWRQLGDVLAANQLRRRGQLARTASLQVHQRLQGMSAPALLAASAVVHGRVAGVAVGAGLAPEPVTLAAAVRVSRLPATVTTPAFRRLVRPGAAVARATATADLAVRTIARFAAEPVPAASDLPDGVATMRPAAEVIGPAAATATLAALHDVQPDDPGRLDVALTALGVATALPTGATLLAGTQTDAVGAVALLESLGAVTETTVTAVLGAAVAGGDPPLPPHVLDPHVLEPHAGGHAVINVHGRVPIIRPNDHTTVVTDITTNRITTGDITVTKVADERWSKIVAEGGIPRRLPSADPTADPGTRLDVFRRDPALLTRLADVATGRPRAAVQLDAAAAAAAAQTVGGAFRSLAAGSFRALLPQPAQAVAGAADLEVRRALLTASAAALDGLVAQADGPPPAVGPVLDVAGTATALLARLDPEVTVAARLRPRLLGGVVVVGVRDELDPVMACPVFLDPMWEGVRDLGTDWLLPGLELVLPDTATLVETNPTFVAAVLAGLNHEFMRELLWREYPTDQRGTSFARFWGRPGADDIPPVHTWAGTLTDNLLAGGDGEAVLLLRSELLRRYPNSIVYLSRAVQAGDQLRLDDATLVLPSFRGDVPPDVTFVGFPIPADDLRSGGGDPWWFVIAQPPAAPRFGLDEPADDTPAVPTTANDLAWSHMSPDGNPATPAPFATADPTPLHGHLIDGLAWGADAAVTARLTYQHPVRVAIRAADLLPPR